MHLADARLLNLRDRDPCSLSVVRALCIISISCQLKRWNVWDAQVAPPTAASIVANGVKANGKAPEPAVEDKPAPAEEKDAAKVEAKEDGEEVRCRAVLFCAVRVFFPHLYLVLPAVCHRNMRISTEEGKHSQPDSVQKLLPVTQVGSYRTCTLETKRCCPKAQHLFCPPPPV